MFEQNQGLLRPALQPLDAAAAQGRLRQGCVGVPVGSLVRPCQEVQIPPQESHFYVAAARRQPVGRAPDVPVLNTVDPERVLSSRFAYKDKNHTRRKHDSTLPCRPKATLCVAGQHDPDLGRMDTWQQRRLPRGRVGRKPSRSGRSRATRTTPRQPGAAGADQESRTTIGSVSWLANLR